MHVKRATEWVSDLCLKTEAIDRTYIALTPSTFPFARLYAYIQEIFARDTTWAPKTKKSLGLVSGYPLLN